MNYTVKLISALAVSLVSATAMVGCSDNNSPAPTPAPTPTPTPAPATSSITGRVAKGPLVGATCTVLNAAGATVAGATAVTGTDGAYTIANVPNNQFPVVLSCTGGSFFDEATNATVNLPAATALRAVVPATRAVNGTAQVSVTPITDAAAALFTALPAQQRSNAAAQESNSQIASALIPGIDPLGDLTPVTSSNQTLASGQAGQYAAALAAFSFAVESTRQSGESTADALARLTNTITSDVADGVIDGRNSGAAIPNASYSSFSDLETRIESGTDSYEAANPNASGATNANEAQEGNRGDAGVSPTGS